MQQSSHSHPTTLCLTGPVTSDAGHCIARVPQGLGYSECDILLVCDGTSNSSSMCIALPFDSPAPFPPPSSADTHSRKYEGEEYSEIGPARLYIRADATLFVDRVPCRVMDESFRELHTTNGSRMSSCVFCLDKAHPTLVSPRRSRTASKWTVAERIVVEPVAQYCSSQARHSSELQKQGSEPTDGISSGPAILKRVKTAVRSLGRIPGWTTARETSLSRKHPTMTDVQVNCLRLRDATGLNVIANIHIYPCPPVVITENTKINLQTSSGIPVGSSIKQHLITTDKQFSPKPDFEGSQERKFLSPLHTNGNHRKQTSIYNAVQELLLQDASSLSKYGARPVTGLLICGPPGIGKTFSTRKAAEDCGFSVLQILTTDNAYGGVSRSMREVFNIGRRNSESNVIFIDDLDSLCPRRDGGYSDLDFAVSESVQIVSQLLALMDDGSRSSHSAPLYVIGATSRPNAIDPALRRPGRFDRELLLHPPTETERFALLQELEPALSKDTIEYIASLTPGFVAADLAKLCARARAWLEASLSPKESASADSNTSVFPRSTPDDIARFRRALLDVRPSVLRSSVSSEFPITRWSDIGGAGDVKNRLQMAVEWPLKYPSTYGSLGLNSCRGVLLYGPPGCCKTTLVKAAASATGANFFYLTGADIYSCFLGEAERIVRELFQVARAAAPSIIFLDELEALVGRRSFGESHDDGNSVKDRVLSTLLTEMDGLMGLQGVLTIGATNRIDLLDEALLRPGRFDELLQVTLPGKNERLAILLLHAKRLPLANDVDLTGLIELIGEVSGADIAAICQEAGLLAMRGNRSTSDAPLQVFHRHFVESVQLLGL